MSQIKVQKCLSEIMREMVRKGQKIPLIQSLDLGCAHVSCLQYNVSIGMTQFGYMDKNRISLFRCCAGTMNFSGAQLKYDLGDRKEAYTRAVPSPHLAEIAEDCECHEMLPALSACCRPLTEAEGWSTLTSGPIRWGGLFLPVFPAASAARQIAIIYLW